MSCRQDDEEDAVEDAVEEAEEGMEDAEAPAETAETGDAVADEEEATEEPQDGFVKFIQEWFEGANGVYGCHWLLRKALSNCLCERCRADPSKADRRAQFKIEHAEHIKTRSDIEKWAKGWTRPYAKSTCMMILSNLYWCFICFNPIAVAERAKVNQNNLELHVPGSPSSESSGSPTSLAETFEGSQPADKSKCSEWSSLRLILEKLGVHELDDPRLGGKIRWVGCYVWKIRLTDPTLSGTLDDRIGELERLHHLDVSFTKVAGNLSSLQRSTKLQFLNLKKTKITGDMSSLQPLTQLLELFLDETNVTGDLLSLQKATQIRKLSLGSTSITGDLSSLRKLEWLQDLVLTDMKVTGDLADLQHLRKTLFIFHAENTLVTGDLSKLILTQLVRLKLPNTKVTGNLRTALKSKELKEIDLAGSNVSGDISALFQWQQLEEVDLSGTQVSGRLGRAWRGQVPQLRILKLTNCKRLAFIPTGEGLLDLRHHFFSNRFPEKLVLPKLIILELSGSPLNGDLMDLMGPLGMCSALASIRAADCGLTGRLPSLWSQDVQMDHFEWKPRA
eukprot:s1459_g2.t5